MISVVQSNKIKADETVNQKIYTHAPSIVQIKMFHFLLIVQRLNTIATCYVFYFDWTERIKNTNKNKNKTISIEKEKKRKL